MKIEKSKIEKSIKLLETGKFEWTLNKIRTENIISAPIWATKYFFGGFSSTRCYGPISRETNDATLRKWQKPY